MIKRLFTALFVGITSLAYAQCDQYITQVNDEVSGTYHWANSESIIFTENNKNGMVSLLILSSDKKSIIWVNTSTEISCIEEKTKVEILFTDGTRMSLYSDGKFNCKGKFTTYFGSVFGKREEANILASKQMKTIRINGSNYHTENVTERAALIFSESFKCLLEKQKER